MDETPKKKRGRKPLDLDWATIRDRYMLGEPAAQICRDYPDLKPGTLRYRASKEKWPTPRNMKKRLTEELTKVNAAAMRGEISPGEAARRKEDIRVTHETLQQRQEAHAEMICKIAGTKLRRNRLPEIKSWRDADIADKMVRRALRMDDEKNDAIVQIGVLGGGGVLDDYAGITPTSLGGTAHAEDLAKELPPPPQKPPTRAGDDDDVIDI